MESGLCCWSSTTFGGLNLIPPPTRVTITRSRDKFEVDGTGQDMLKGRCRKKRSSTDNKSADAIMQLFAWSPKKSLWNCSCEIGMEKFSVHQILRAQKWKPYILRLCPRSTSLLEVYCARRRTFWTCTGLRSLRNRTQHKLYFSLISLVRNNDSEIVYFNLRFSVLVCNNKL